jgi:hypothetical protein
MSMNARNAKTLLKPPYLLRIETGRPKLSAVAVSKRVQ